MGTYNEIAFWVKIHYGVTVHPCHIAHAKELSGLPVQVANNRQSPDHRQEPCPPDYLPLIQAAFYYYGMIR